MSLMTITSEVANITAGIALLVVRTPLTVVLVTSENLEGSAVPRYCPGCLEGRSSWRLTSLSASRSASDARQPKIVAHRATWRPACLAKVSLSQRAESLAVSSAWDRRASSNVALSLLRATVSLKSLA